MINEEKNKEHGQPRNERIAGQRVPATIAAFLSGTPLEHTDPRSLAYFSQVALDTVNAITKLRRMRGTDATRENLSGRDIEELRTRLLKSLTILQQLTGGAL